MTTSSTPSQQSALRRIGDDPFLRPFLSSLFDPQAYVRSIIKDGKSDECLTSITECTEKINDEIQKFISKNKDSLMSGMQDVSTLAEKYHSLADHSQNLQTIVQRMKRDSADSYNLIKSRTSELERIHDASMILNYLKRFVKAKTQLDQYLQNPEDKDLRSLAAAAKIVAELEKLLAVPLLQEVQIVSTNIPAIKTFGNNIRMLSQSKLLEATVEKNQAAIGNYLQVFYNLESLPEIVLFVIDHTARLTADASRDALALDTLQTLHHDYLHKSNSAGSAATGGVSLPPSAHKRGTGAAGSIPGNSTVTLSQLRIAIRELTHHWSTAIFEHATQILVLQRVIMKKEDPTSHEKFIYVLLQKAPTVSNSNNSEAATSTTQQLLAQGQLVGLLWHRLSTSLSDVCAEKLRQYPEIASRVYPYLRRAAVDVLQNLQAWADEDKPLRGHQLWSSWGAACTSIDSLLSTSDSIFSGGDFGPQWERDGAIAGMFGSLLWNEDALLGSSRSSSNSQGSALEKKQTNKPVSTSHKTSLDNAKNTGSTSNSNEHDLIHGLKPIRDRYLLGVLDRMNGPIAQMFPDLDGYIAAVPSKRDLQTLIKQIQQEFVTAATESDLGLIRLVAREFQKTVQIMLTKIESMILTTPETRKMNTAAQQAFARNHPQEHNGQCFQLLVQFREALEKIPSQVIQHLDEMTTSTVGGTGSSQALKTPLKSNATTIAASSSKGDLAAATSLSAPSSSTVVGTSTDGFADKVFREIALATEQACVDIDELASRHILDPIVGLLTEYSTSVLVQLHKELVVLLPTVPAASTAAHDPSTLENSLAVQALLKQLPVFIKAHLTILPKSVLVDRALEELAIRLLMVYISTAALVRPANELTRLRAAKDLSALELALSFFVPMGTLVNCPVLREYRAFRRFLFEEKLFANEGEHDVTNAALTRRAQSQGNSHVSAPNRSRLFALDYIHDLRPSTVLATLMSVAPVQLPLPCDGKDFAHYISDLVKFEIPSPSKSGAGGSSGKACSVRSIYTANASTGSANGNASNTMQSWKKVAAERQSWERVQECLDVFFQRLTVAEGDQKQEMRAWYEAIMDVGSNYFY